MARWPDPLRDDPELGEVRRCTVCGEWWPNDNEFYSRIVPARCRACVAEMKAAYDKRARPDRKRAGWRAKQAEARAA